MECENRKKLELVCRCKICRENPNGMTSVNRNTGNIVRRNVSLDERREQRWNTRTTP